VVDHHVDRPEVEAGQPAQLTGTNRSTALECPHPAARIILPDEISARRTRSRIPGGRPLSAAEPRSAATRMQLASIQHPGSKPGRSLGYPWEIKGRGPQRPGPRTRHSRTRHSRTGPGGHSEGQNTRSHPELGRENPQRQWYCVSRRGRVGRRQARPLPHNLTAGWSSPVARQAHNLKVRGSNPLPATNFQM
jgi:hypothetical protein